jgi:hypothetical protein
MKPLMYALLMMGFAVTVLCRAREFTDATGRKVNGDLLAHAGDQIVLQVGAKEFVVQVTNFSAEDQQFIQDWIVANPGAVRYRFSFYTDLEKLSVSQAKAPGSMYEDKLKVMPQEYEMIVFNKEVAPVTDLEIRYEIYIDDFVDIRGNAFTAMAVGGEKKARLETVAGSFPVASIPAGGRVDFTRAFNIEFYIDRDGGKTDAAATDKVMGVRIRVYKGDQVIGEVADDLESYDIGKVPWQNEAATEGTVIK